jgi:flagellar hook-length control protein FliK
VTAASATGIAAAGPARSGALARSVAGAAPGGESEITVTAPRPAEEVPPAPDASIALSPAAGAGRKAQAGPLDVVAGGGSPPGTAEAHSALSPTAQPPRTPEGGDGSVAKKTDESGSSPPRPADAAPVAIMLPAAVAHASGASSQLPATQGNTVLVPAHVESPAWSKDFSQHVIRLAVAGQPAAEIHLNPPDWGPIRVAIEIKGQEATLQFAADQPQTRLALEGALPQLRDMFATDNLALVSVNVAGQASLDLASGSRDQRFDPPQPVAGNRPSRLVADASPPAGMARTRPGASRSRVDLFA